MFLVRPCVFFANLLIDHKVPTWLCGPIHYDRSLLALTANELLLSTALEVCFFQGFVFFAYLLTNH